MKSVNQSESEKALCVSTDESSPEKQCLNYQLEFLKLEFATINEAIKRIDQTTQTIKNWTLLIWAGGISLAIGQVRQLGTVLDFDTLANEVWGRADGGMRDGTCILVFA